MSSMALLTRSATSSFTACSNSTFKVSMMLSPSSRYSRNCFLSSCLCFNNSLYGVAFSRFFCCSFVFGSSLYSCCSFSCSCFLFSLVSISVCVSASPVKGSMPTISPCFCSGFISLGEVVFCGSLSCFVCSGAVCCGCLFFSFASLAF